MPKESAMMFIEKMEALLEEFKESYGISMETGEESEYHENMNEESPPPKPRMRGRRKTFFRQKEEKPY